jgi:hypothetical protein
METYATVSTATPFAVTTAAEGGSGTQKVIVGKVSWAISKGSKVAIQAGAVETGTAGTLKAGTGTVLLLSAP